MTRSIVCKACAAKQRPMHPEDVLNGFHRRTVDLLAVKKPDEHGITVIEDGKRTYTALRSLMCDTCNEPITDGTGAVAVTYWNEHREGEPGNWEKVYSA